MASESPIACVLQYPRICLCRNAVARHEILTDTDRYRQIATVWTCAQHFEDKVPTVIFVGILALLCVGIVSVSCQYLSVLSVFVGIKIRENC